jgi:hypothetical protein
MPSIAQTQEFPVCVRCGKPVEVHQKEYDLHERMHWLCFHLEFEHEGDPDKACADPSCPWWHIQVYRQQLEKMGVNSSDILNQAIVNRWHLGNDDSSVAE